MKCRFQYKPELLFATFDIEGRRETGKVVEESEHTIKVWYRGRIIQRHRTRDNVKRAPMFEMGSYWAEPPGWKWNQKKKKMKALRLQDGRAVLVPANTKLREHPYNTLRKKQKVKKSRKQRRAEARETSGAGSEA